MTLFADRRRKVLRPYVVEQFLRDYFRIELVAGVEFEVKADEDDLRIDLRRGDKHASLEYRMQWLADRGDPAGALLLVVHEVEHALRGIQA